VLNLTQTLPEPTETAAGGWHYSLRFTRSALFREARRHRAPLPGEAKGFGFQAACGAPLPFGKKGARSGVSV